MEEQPEIWLKIAQMQKRPAGSETGAELPPQPKQHGLDFQDFY